MNFNKIPLVNPHIAFDLKIYFGDYLSLSN